MISFAITACNEYEELKRLLGQISSHLLPEDEVVIQLDTTATPEVREIASNSGFVVVYFPLNNDFAQFKNNLKNSCSKEYIFFIDADEYLSDGLLIDLHGILDLNPNIDLYAIPRENYVEGISQEHIQKWGWNIDELNRINHPDYQYRIVRNIDSIKWVGKVHERLLGDHGLMITSLPDEYHLIHPKTIHKQEKQNEMYSKM